MLVYALRNAAVDVNYNFSSILTYDFAAEGFQCMTSNRKTRSQSQMHETTERMESELRETVDTCEGFELSPEEKNEREVYRQKINEAKAGKLEQSKEKLIDAVLNGPRNKS